MSAVDLEVTIRPAGSAYRVEARCTAPDTDAPTDAAATIQIDRLRLDALTLDSAAYGLALGEMVLAGLIGAILGTARAVAEREGVPLRLRLALDPDVDALHTLRWETLRDPARPDQPLLTTGAQVVFSRYLSSSAWQPVRVPPLEELRALVVLSSPLDLSDFGLSPLDLETERTLVTASFGQIPVTVLGRGAANLDTITQHLGDGYDILYLLAHGRADENGETWVFLEDADGLTAPTQGSALATRIAELERRPRLVLLGSCETAGALLALGPRLAQVGVPAVVGMQDKITVATLRRFLPECLKVLQRGGRIDLAVAQARGLVRGRADFWMPVLFLRLTSGRLWAVPAIDPDDALPPLQPPIDLPDLFPMCNNLIGHGDVYDQLWATFEATMRGPSGRVCVITGQPGCGRSALAHAIADDAQAQGAVVVRVRAWPLSRAEAETEEALAADDPLADPEAQVLEGEVAWCWPEATSIGGAAWVRVAAQLCVALGQVPHPRQRADDSPLALLHLLRLVARERPVVLVVEQLEEQPDWWLLLLGERQLPREIERDLPVLLLATLRLPRRLEELASAEQEEQAVALIRELLAQGQADVFWLDVVTVDDVRAFIGEAERGLARRLHQIAGGIPAMVESLWWSWQESGVVAQDDDGVWRVADDTLGWVSGELRDAPQRLLEARLGASAPVDVDEADRILGMAALEGPSFTAQAVARTLELSDDTVLNLLDDWLLDADGEPGLVREVGFVDVAGRLPSARPSVYRFAYPHLWHLWARYGLPAQRLATRRKALAEALELVYYPDVEKVADRLVALFEAAGLSARAHPYRQRQQRRIDIALLRWLIAQLEAEKRAGTLSSSRGWWLFEWRLELSNKLYQAGHYYEGFTSAEAARQQAQVWKNTLCEAQAANEAGACAERDGAYREARTLLERALAIREEVLGERHPLTALSLNNLASLLEAQGARGEARLLLERALAIQEEVLGERHPLTALGLNNLAYLLQVQEEKGRALLLYERALAIREEVLGADHPDTASTLNNLGFFHQAQQAYDRALSYYHRALAIFTRVLGPSHPNTRACRNLCRTCLAEVHLGLLPPAGDTQRAQVLAQARAATDAALADPAADRCALATALEACVRWAEEGEAEGSPYLALAAELRALIVQLGVTPDDPDAL
jgi:tetratricopeptide (TPR) repeat protein